MGGDRVFFGTGGAVVQTLDLDSGVYRPSTLADLHDFTRLQDTCLDTGLRAKVGECQRIGDLSGEQDLITWTIVFRRDRQLAVQAVIVTCN